MHAFHYKNKNNKVEKWQEEFRKQPTEGAITYLQCQENLSLVFQDLTTVNHVARHGAVISNDAAHEGNGVVDFLWQLQNQSEIDILINQSSNQ